MGVALPHLSGEQLSLATKHVDQVFRNDPNARYLLQIAPKE